MAAKRQALHDQDWRDYQPTLDPEINPQKFKVALQEAKRKISAKKTALRSVAVGSSAANASSKSKTH
jgi:hypothetical protein